tara:strand:+ start:1505 stop:1681 length:177 start_codon:yes stop_codon:yes gene_type:complete
MTKEQILDKLYQAKDYASDALNVAQQASELASEAETQAIETYDNVCDAIDMVEELEDE